MKHILVTTDFSSDSESAFQYATEQVKLIGKEHCKVTLLTVVDDAPPENINFEFGLALENKKDVVEALYNRAENNIKKTAEQHFADVSVELAVLKPSAPVDQEIVDYAKRHDVDLIVMSTHGRTGIQHFFLGSVAERVIRQALCPVLVVPASGRSDYMKANDAAGGAPPYGL